MNNIIFVSGIGTNVGKSYVTGWLANEFMVQGKKAITLKMIQTGNNNFSEDIEIHRRIMGIPYTEDDLNHITAPIIMTYPASPHLAAKIDNVDIDLSKIDNSIDILSKRYDVIIMEGAGGLMVPITEDCLTIDYIKEKNFPVCLVTNGTLGSINHTLLSLEALKSRNIKLKYLVYNSYFDEDKLICDETIKYLNIKVNEMYPNADFYTISALNLDK